MWHRHDEELPHWASAVKQVLLVQPSSAAAETESFQHFRVIYQDNALVEYLQTSVMFQEYQRIASAESCSEGLVILKNRDKSDYKLEIS